MVAIDNKCKQTKNLTNLNKRLNFTRVDKFCDKQHDWQLSDFSIRMIMTMLSPHRRVAQLVVGVSFDEK